MAVPTAPLQLHADILPDMLTYRTIQKFIREDESAKLVANFAAPWFRVSFSARPDAFVRESPLDTLAIYTQDMGTAAAMMRFHTYDGIHHYTRRHRALDFFVRARAVFCEEMCVQLVGNSILMAPPRDNHLDSDRHHAEYVFHRFCNIFDPPVGSDDESSDAWQSPSEYSDS